MTTYIFKKAHHALCAWLDHGIDSVHEMREGDTESMAFVLQNLGGGKCIGYDFVADCENWQVVPEHEHMMLPQVGDLVSKLFIDDTKIIKRNNLPFPPYEIIEES